MSSTTEIAIQNIDTALQMLVSITLPLGLIIAVYLFMKIGKR